MSMRSLEGLSIHIWSYDRTLESGMETITGYAEGIRDHVFQAIYSNYCGKVFCFRSSEKQAKKWDFRPHNGV